MSANWNRYDLSHEALKAWQTAHPELDPDRGKPRRTPTINHDYDTQGDSKPMTTAPAPLTPAPLTPAQQAEAFREEIRASFELLRAENDSIRHDLETLINAVTTITAGIQYAATATPPTQTDGENFTATMIEREKKKGKYYYKLKGGTYTRHGITIWPEILEALGLADVEYSEDDTHKITPPMEVHVSWEWYTDDESKQQKRRKVTGRA